MCWAYRAEVPPIEGRYLHLAAALCCRDDRRVNATQRKVSVAADKFCDSQPVLGGHRLRDQVPGREVSEEADLRVGTEPGREQVHHLGHYQFGHDQRPWMGLQQLEAFGVMVVIRVDVRVQRTGVNQQSYRRTSARRISSIRTDTSAAPLRPAPAASRRRRPRRPPRCSSIASRVTSEMVTPRRCASCRSRASRSSGSFTVVRFMVCQHTCPERPRDAPSATRRRAPWRSVALSAGSREPPPRGQDKGNPALGGG